MPGLEAKEPSQTIDALEFARGALCVTSYVGVDQAREVHISALLAHFDRAGLVSTEALKTLWFLREAQSLDGGYWIPAPARAVRLTGELCIVVAIQPTEELNRHLPSITRAGSARIANTGEVSSLPTQAVKSWRGADGQAASVWAKSAIEAASNKFSPSMGEEELEAFGTRLSARGLGHWEPTWVRGSDGHACTWRGVGLFRARTGPATYRYFLGKRQDQALFQEGPAVHDAARMQFGLGALQGRPFHPIIESASGAATIRLPIAAPAAVRRLLVALCDEVPRSVGRVWTCRLSHCMPALTNVLLELSEESEERE